MSVIVYLDNENLERCLNVSGNIRGKLKSSSVYNAKVVIPMKDIIFMNANGDTIYIKYNRK